MTCTVPDCDRQHEARGYCSLHYKRWKRHGDPLASQPAQITGDPVARLLQHTDQTDTCWLWTGALIHNGYGVMTLDGRRQLVHRLAYQFFVGPIPDGLQIDHLCRVRHCLRPEHLEPVTAQENSLRGETIAASRAAQTTCIHGHPFDDENTYVTPKGTRQCRACRRTTTKAPTNQGASR